MTSSGKRSKSSVSLMRTCCSTSSVQEAGGSADKAQICSAIQSPIPEVRPYTPRETDSTQPGPKDATPTSTWSSVKIGSPDPPIQAVFPEGPAQNSISFTMIPSVYSLHMSYGTCSNSHTCRCGGSSFPSLS